MVADTGGQREHPHLFLQLVRYEVQVAQRRADVGVAEHSLYRVTVGSVGQQACCGGVAQEVGMQSADTRSLGEPVKGRLDGLVAERLALDVEEEGFRHEVSRNAVVCRVSAQRLLCCWANRDVASSSPLLRTFKYISLMCTSSSWSPVTSSRRRPLSSIRQTMALSQIQDRRLARPETDIFSSRGGYQYKRNQPARCTEPTLRSLKVTEMRVLGRV